MKPKKTPKADLTKDHGLYFAIGLALVLFITWQAIEWKTYEKVYEYKALNVDADDSEEIPITKQLKTPPPPPPPPAPAEVIEVVENEKEIEETVIESTETNEDDIVDVEEVDIIEDPQPLDDIPFAIIEDVPLFPGCEKVAKSKRRDCFQKKINKHVKKHFRYPEIAQEMGVQGKVYVSFIISKDGSIVDIKTRGPDKSLEKEAYRIISKLPKMTPGKQRGRPVRVPFSIPITFRLQ